MNLSKILLTNGIKEMISENEDHFKQNIEQTLAIKLNDCIQEAKSTVCEKLFDKEDMTPSSEELLEFVRFMSEASEGKIIFQDGTMLNIKEQEIKEIKELFESLNSTNRLKMAQEVLKNSLNFKQHLEFAEKIKGLK
jgi:hypothetical protein